NNVCQRGTSHRGHTKEEGIVFRQAMMIAGGIPADTKDSKTTALEGTRMLALLTEVGAVTSGRSRNWIRARPRGTTRSWPKQTRRLGVFGCRCQSWNSRSWNGHPRAL